MQYLMLFMKWVLVVAAAAAALKGIYVFCSKKAIDPSDIFKKIEVKEPRKFNRINGGMHMAVAAVIAFLLFTFENNNSLTTSVSLLLLAALLAGEQKMKKMMKETV